MPLINPGFKAPDSQTSKLPPGQTLVKDWPVLTYGPTPKIPTDTWRIMIDGEVNGPTTLTWDQFIQLPHTKLTTDIHCVTRWSKIGMNWEGIAIDELVKAVGGLKPSAKFLLASCYGGYTTNLPIADLAGNQALVATHADGAPLAPEHGGPARLFVPHLYFWKSAKYVNRLTFMSFDQPGFWEHYGYHNYGDPWREQRYDTDE